MDKNKKPFLPYIAFFAFATTVGIFATTHGFGVIGYPLMALGLLGVIAIRFEIRSDKIDDGVRKNEQ